MAHLIHALVLNLHQPPGNLEPLLATDEWAAGATGRPEWSRRLAKAHGRVRRAETSCHFFWGEAWRLRCHRDLDEAWAILKQGGR